jgi:hypothetical protein
MDKFVAIIGTFGFVLLAVAFTVIIYAIINLAKRRTRFGKFLSSTVLFLILFGFGFAFASLALFLHTFSRYIHEDRIGWIYAERIGDNIKMSFHNEKRNDINSFELSGDQWMVEGYIMRWNLSLRWLGADSYYRIARFSGRSLTEKEPKSSYKIAPENALWKFLLTQGKKIPFVDAAYGIAVFQYPSRDTFYLYINDTGFILKQH